MGVYVRGKRLWIRFRDVDGWRDASTGYSVGDEAKAAQVLAEVESRVRLVSASRRTSTTMKLRSVDPRLARLEYRRLLAERDRRCGDVCRAQGLIGYTYALRAENGLYKIGHTKQGDGSAKTPLDYLVSKQFGSPLRLDLVGWSHDARLEELLHSKFADQRRHGEWFALDASPLGHAADVCEGGIGLASRLAAEIGARLDAAGRGEGL